MTCTECGKTAKASSFSAAVGDPRCKTCVRRQKRMQRRDECAPARPWRGDKYGLSEAEYEVMFTRQGGRCLLCGVEAKLLVIDHDHQTGRIRGLLCGHCNTGLGMFKDNPDALRAAIWYLENHSRRVRAAG